MMTHGLTQALLATLLSCGVFLVVSELQVNLVAEAGPGVSAPYLPAGVRLIASAVLGVAGCVGVAAASWLVASQTFSTAGGGTLLMIALVSGFVPLLALMAFRRVYGIGEDLRDLSFRGLLVLAALQSTLSPLAHQAVFYVSGAAPASVANLLVMVAGDMVGCMLVVLALAALWRLVRSR
ncbi:MAG: hypothetical protein EBS23_00275 [Betaproteobacteria bacterium]|nr:hypothetical protein [Betaproteobacteria bacterium]